MKRRAISVAMFFFLLCIVVLPLSVFAVSQRCIDNTTLERDFNYTFGIDANDMNLTVTRQEDCQYGCDNVTNTCAPNPTELSWGIAILIISLIFAYGAVAKVFR